MKNRRAVGSLCPTVCAIKTEGKNRGEGTTSVTWNVEVWEKKKKKLIGDYTLRDLLDGSVREHFFLLYEIKSENREISGLGLRLGLGLPCYC